MRKLESLQFLRFLAFMLVFLFHSSNFGFLYNPGGGAAASAVSFFILLSGFLSGYSCGGSEVKCSFSDTIAYVIKKGKKFYPLYIATTAVTLLYCGLKTYILAGDTDMVLKVLVQLLKNVLLLQAWFPEGYFSFNSVSWFLSAMMLLYFCKTPVSGLLKQLGSKTHGTYLLIGFFLVLSILFGTYCYIIGQTAYSPEFWLYIFPPARVAEFICGMICGFLMYRLYHKLQKPNGIFFTVLETASLLVWYMAYKSQGMEWECRSLRWFLPNLFIICVFSMDAGWISRVFSLKWLRHLGDITFEAYILHQVIITLCSYGAGAVAGYVEQYVNAGVWNALLQTGCLAATLVLSHLLGRAKNGKRF